LKRKNTPEIISEWHSWFISISAWLFLPASMIPYFLLAFISLYLTVRIELIYRAVVVLKENEKEKPDEKDHVASVACRADNGSFLRKGKTVGEV
jgi:hypothetical protein